jgi:hypothetical protein
MNLNFEPYIGVPPLTFGMTITDAINLLGSPKSKEVNTFGPKGQELAFEEVRLAFDAEERLYQIGFDKSYEGNLLFNNIDILRHPEALKTLLEADGEPFIWVGFVMLMKLGIRLGGYHENADGGRTISIFNRGRYDSKIPRFRPFQIGTGS